jgi:AdoMet-dependent heme synthase
MLRCGTSGRASRRSDGHDRRVVHNAAHPRRRRRVSAAAFVFEDAPRRVYWETTRACDLVCRHCRAEAAPAAHPDELTEAEGRRLLEDLARFGSPLPHIVLTGGDPLKRGDLLRLIRHAGRLGFSVSVAPSATPLLGVITPTAMKAAGVRAISLSLDGSSAARHAALRGVPGCFARTMQAVTEARDAGLPFQLNTLVSAETVDDLPAIRRLAARLGAVRWSLFFLVSVGRGARLRQITPDQFMIVLDWLVETDAAAGEPVIATTEAPQLRRMHGRWRRHPWRQWHRVRFAYRGRHAVGLPPARCR